MKIQKEKEAGSWRVHLEPNEASLKDTGGWIGTIKTDPNVPSAAMLHVFRQPKGGPSQRKAHQMLEKAAQGLGFLTSSKTTVDH